jgi:hypothetical protein
VSRETAKAVLIVCIGLPLLFMHAAWATPALHAYLLTALLFGLLLVPDYPHPETPGFRRTIFLILVTHSAVLMGIVELDLKWGTIVGQFMSARMAFGLLGIALMLEWRVALRIIGARAPESE